MNKQKGFTIIELLVVIAIIAVLASIVLVNVTGYINKGKDASAEGNLATLMTNAAVFFDTTSLGNGTFNGFFTTTGTSPVGSATAQPIITALTASGMGYTVTAYCNTSNCAATATAWCASIALKSQTSTNYCVDSTGFKGTGKTCANTGACT